MTTQHPDVGREPISVLYYAASVVGNRPAGSTGGNCPTKGRRRL